MQGLESSEMAKCIEACLDCHRTCEEMALDHCLRLGGKHVERDHFALMLNCADICRTAAHFMMADSELHPRVCDVCAEVCAACAESCERVGAMAKCVKACRACEQECRAMAGALVA